MKKRIWKKIAALIMTTVMAVPVLAGCGSGGEGASDSGSSVPTENAENSGEEGQEETGQPDNGDGQGSQAEGENGWDGEVSKIIMTYATGGVEPADIRLVQDAINEISMEEVGVEVEFKPVSIFDMPSTCPMWIGGGEQIDLMLVAFTGLMPYVSQNMIEPLEQWVDMLPAVQALEEEEYAVFDLTSEEHIYGVAPVNSQFGRGGGYLIAVEDLKAAGLSYQDGDLVTLDDMDLIFEKIKEAKPDVTPCGVVGNQDRGPSTFVYDTLGAGTSSGGVIGIDSTEVVNIYASPEYRSYLEHVRKWYEKGYILKDAATTDISLNDLSISGALSGYFSEGQANLRNTLELQTGREYIHLMFNEPYNPAISASTGAYWTVPVTAKEPEAAMRFLNLMYQDSRIANLILYGIEGTHYVYLDKEKGTITYPEGVDASNSTYNYGLGFYGNMIDVVSMGESTKEEDQAWSATARNRTTKGFGFNYDTTAMTNQIIAVEAVITEYVPALTTGSADLETTYAEFLSKLEANGINEIIADKQAQFDEWLAKQ